MAILFPVFKISVETYCRALLTLFNVLNTKEWIFLAIFFFLKESHTHSGRVSGKKREREMCIFHLAVYSLNANGLLVGSGWTSLVSYMGGRCPSNWAVINATQRVSGTLTGSRTAARDINSLLWYVGILRGSLTCTKSFKRFLQFKSLQYSSLVMESIITI